MVDQLFQETAKNNFCFSVSKVQCSYRRMKTMQERSLNNAGLKKPFKKKPEPSSILFHSKIQGRDGDWRSDRMDDSEIINFI